MKRTLVLSAVWLLPAAAGAQAVDFTRDVRPILSNGCYRCHGPDENERKGGKKSTGALRLDTRAGAVADLGGRAAVVPGRPEASELIRRVGADDDDRMPPKGHGERLDPRQVDLLKRWIAQGAPYAVHWAYVKPRRPDPPAVRAAAWPKNAIDRFVLARLEREGLAPQPEADRATLARRLSIDLTGLPPTLEELGRVEADLDPAAVEALVDRLLASPHYGERWARLWLDLARYADSAGYAEDQPRTIWAWRDWVIRSFNANLPFDRFTVDQIAGDLLPDPTEEQIVATAFHRNTMTNTEGGTDDEEFRNVAIVDRVNTTMEIWMAATMACAQCHNHKYDPISNEEYFRFFAFLNNTEDNDQPGEVPVLPIFSDEQKRRKAAALEEIAALERSLEADPEPLAAGRKAWEALVGPELAWTPARPAEVASSGGATLSVLEDGSVLAGGAGPAKDTTTLTFRETPARLTALRVEALTHDSLPARGPGRAGHGNFVLSRVLVTVALPDDRRPEARTVRIELPGKGKILSLAEVEVYSGDTNVARGGKASQVSTAFEGPAGLAVDGTTDGRYYESKSVTHTAQQDDPWWELELAEPARIDRIVVWNRTDGGDPIQQRLKGYRLKLLDAARAVIWEEEPAGVPAPSAERRVGGPRPVSIGAASADHEQEGFGAAHLVKNAKPKELGWAVGGEPGKDHAAWLVLDPPIESPPGAVVTVVLEQTSKHTQHTLGRVRISFTGDARAAAVVAVPPPILAIARTPAERRTPEQADALAKHYRTIAPELRPIAEKIAALRKTLEEMKPATTVPIMRELTDARRRQTHIQVRGNFLVKDREVAEGTPAVFHPLRDDAPRNRLGLARWLVDPENPLTARVIVNRFWEQLFGTGLVATVEDFGIQGELPSHPELLDWLAVEFVESGWDVKKLLRLMATSATYRQSSRVTAPQYERDPDNRLLARGPRVRLSADQVRDQALEVAGLLSRKLYGPPVQPPRPKLGLTAAFAGSTDWETSPGEDKWRRGLYTNWRRSIPYPSMATFDAPSGEVCTSRRSRTNTPLQALVTLNDPVYVEAAQALARRILKEGGADDAARAAWGLRLCLARAPEPAERDRLVELVRAARSRYEADPKAAAAMATDPLGPAPDGTPVAELAAWTVAGNVLLNLDEMFMKR
jgi:hypothetical protein